MAGTTNRGAFRIAQAFYRNTSIPTNLFAFLATSAAAPTADTNLKSDLTEIAAGNGYTAGGLSLNRNSTDFDVLTEDDTNDRAFVQIKDLVWTASGGPIPAIGGGARYLPVTDDNATPANRDVIHYFDLAADRTVSAGQSLTIQDAEIRLRNV